MDHLAGANLEDGLTKLKETLKVCSLCIKIIIQLSGHNYQGHYFHAEDLSGINTSVRE